MILNNVIKNIFRICKTHTTNCCFNIQAGKLCIIIIWRIQRCTQPRWKGGTKCCDEDRSRRAWVCGNNGVVFHLWGGVTIPLVGACRCTGQNNLLIFLKFLARANYVLTWCASNSHSQLPQAFHKRHWQLLGKSIGAETWMYEFNT